MGGWLKQVWRKLIYIGWWLCHEWLYDACWFVGRVTAPIVSHVDLEGTEKVPHSGPVILTANHMSQWDLLFIHNLMPRPGFFMTKREYFDIFFMGGFVKLLGAFPVNRGKYDRQALQNALGLLDKGQQVVIFPEGTRSKDNRLHLVPNGAALLASKTDALVVPIAFAGTEKISREPEYAPDGKKIKPVVRIRVGEPYRLHRTDPQGRRYDLDDLSDIMMGKIAELLPPSYQGDYTPEKITARKQERAGVRGQRSEIRG